MTRHAHVSLLLAGVLTLGLGGCGDDNTSANGDASTAADASTATDASTTPDAGTTPDGSVIDSGVDCTNAYIVAPDGVAGNPGTLDEPFATVQDALDTPALGPGDVICLRGGTYYPTDRTSFRNAGTAADYLVIGAYPGELPIINGRDIPEGDTDGGSTVTWAFLDAQYWKVQGPIRITNGRGAGVYIEDSQFIELHLVESSYNGNTAARAGHGFFLWGDGTSDILFRNCDGHHNANHRWRSGEDQVENQYQHGDGWRIFAGTHIRLVGCRAWHNLDDGYDFTQAPDPVVMEDCWAAYSGVDDAAGSITGTPDRAMRRWEGDGIKLGYEDDTGAHQAIRCLSWNNNSHGFTVRGGPYTIYNSAAYNNVEAAFANIDNNSANVRKNTYGFQNAVGDGAGAADYSGITVSSSDFVSLDDAGMLGPRGPGGALPVTDFLRPAPGGSLVDVGVDLGLPFEGTAPDIGPFEHTP